MAKKKRKRSGRKGSALTKDAMGMFGYAVADGFIDNALRQFGLNIPGDIAQTALGYFLKKRGGMLGSVGKIMFYVNGTQVIKGFMAGGLNLGGIFGNTGNGQATTGGFYE